MRIAYVLILSWNSAEDYFSHIRVNRLVCPVPHMFFLMVHILAKSIDSDGDRFEPIWLKLGSKKMPQLANLAEA
jgi:hypothetical protein